MKNRKLTYSHWSRDNIITDVSTVASINAEETCQSNFKRVAGRLSTVKCECGGEGLRDAWSKKLRLKVLTYFYFFHIVLNKN
jgi:hypothetical protein